MDQPVRERRRVVETGPHAAAEGLRDRVRRSRAPTARRFDDRKNLHSQGNEPISSLSRKRLAQAAAKEAKKAVADSAPVFAIELSPYRTHSMRRADMVQIYREIDNLRTVWRLFGHTEMDSRVRGLGLGLENVHAISEATEI